MAPSRMDNEVLYDAPSAGSEHRTRRAFINLVGASLEFLELVADPKGNDGNEDEEKEEFAVPPPTAPL